MSVYYNEFDPKAAAWIRELIRLGLVPDGEVDERSILDVDEVDLWGFDQHHFFAGIGGWPFALRLAGLEGVKGILTGSPPCFSGDSLVLTNEGLRPISSLSTGDYVLTHKSRYRKVTAIGSKFASTVTVKGQGSVGIVSTENHPFYVRQKGIEHRRKHELFGKMVFKSDPQWVAARDILGMHWASPNIFPCLPVPEIEHPVKGYFFSNQAGKWQVKGEKDQKPVHIGFYDTEKEAVEARIKAVIEGEIDVRGAQGFDPEELGSAFFLGYWLGDGWTSGDDVFLCAALGEENELRSILQRSGLSAAVRQERTSCRLQVGSKGLVKWLRGQFGTSAHNKSIPSWALGMPVEWRQSFLDGYERADGHRETQKKGGGNVVCYTTVSPALATSVRLLINSLGKSASITWANTSDQTIEGRKVNSLGFYRVTQYETSRSFCFDGGHGWGKVRSITPSPVEQRVWNIAVEEDESYTVSGVVVHNCQPFSSAGQQKGKDDERHLAPKFIELVRAIRPRVLFGEQVASAAVFGKAAGSARKRAGAEPVWAWLDDLSDRLEAAHYAVGASDIPAAGVGAPHIRQRTFFGAVSLGGMADTERTRPEAGVSEAQRGHQRDAEVARDDGHRWTGQGSRGSDVGWMADTRRTVLQSRVGFGNNTDETRKAERETRKQQRGGIGDRNSGVDDGLEVLSGFEAIEHRRGASPTDGPWGDVDWLFCRDGKWRPVIGTHEPLADGLPTRMVQGRNLFHPLTEGEEARVPRLKGYGNAIVPQVAAVFIESFMESLWWIR